MWASSAILAQGGALAIIWPSYKNIVSGVAMAITGMGGYSGPNIAMQLMRNESTSDSLAAMLGPGLQGVCRPHPSLDSTKLGG